ncbi:MAG: DUF4031 domain-containing protein, partial [Vicinamibacterales bacterium]
MPAFVDEPKHQRDHGLSGHLIGIPLEDARQVASVIGLSDRYFMGQCIVPHWQLPAGRRDAAIAAGAIPLTAAQWTAKLSSIGRDPPSKSRPDNQKKLS